MKKFFLQLVIFAGVFFLLWWGLSRVPWVEKLHIQKFTKERQEDLSELVLKLHKMDKKEVSDSQTINAVLSIRNAICKANYIDTSEIKIHVFEDELINAFALPGGHIIVNTALITYCDNPDMLAGVMAHEMAHVELDHVSRKLAREIGISTLVAVTGGAEHIGVLKEILHTLSSRGFDRDLEREADANAVVYMQNANADARQLAMFLKKLSATYPDAPGGFQWISTHPDTKERVNNILAISAAAQNTTPILDSTEWGQLQSSVMED